MSFSSANISIDERGYVLVCGENHNKNDSAQSNGSGKSALFESIIYALTGDTARGTKDVVNLYSDGNCTVSLDFDVDENNYKVVRGKDKTKSYLQIIKNGVDISAKGIRDTEKVLSDQLPELSASLLGSVVILGQGLPQRFSNNSPSGRKELLETMSKSDFMIDDLKARLTNRVEFLKNHKVELQKDLAVFSTKLEYSKQELNRINTFLENLVPIDALREELLCHKADLESLEKELCDKKSELCTIEQTIENYRDALAKNNTRLSTNKEFICKKYDNELNGICTALAIMEVELKSKRQTLYDLSNVRDVCPTCGQKINGVVKPDTTQLQEQIEKLTTDNRVLTNKKVELLATKEKEIAELEKKYSIVNSNYLAYIDAATKNKKTIQDMVSDYNKRILELRTTTSILENKISNHEAEKKDSEKRAKLEHENINNFEQKILNINSEITSTDMRLSVLSKMNTIVTRELRGILLTNVIAFINKVAKDYSNSLFENNLVYLQLDSNNLNIYLGDRQYESLSTGERLKCDIVIQLSIRKMLCEFLNFSCNIIVLDELFDGLDKLGCERVLSLLFDGLDDITTTFIITHRSDLPITCDDTITVEKDISGVSSIK